LHDFQPATTLADHTVKGFFRMGDRVGMAAQFAGNALRFGWYYGINWLAGREAAKRGPQPAYKPTRPVPSRQELFGSLAQVLVEDAQRVRDGVYPGDGEAPHGLGEHLARLHDMIADIPSAVERRTSKDATSARKQPESARLPAYFTQDFHFQSGGYLTEDSARLYDIQVETLFYGSAAAMRRSALAPINAFMKGRDQRWTSLLDVACGTGRFLRQVRLAFPAMALTGLDLSEPYLAEAARHLGGLRPARLVAANAEAIPLPDASQDIVTCIFLFHELPPEVRRRVTGEIARVLKPGGLFVFLDSLQYGDRPGWDGLLESFPVRFHEPYFRSYVEDDLDRIFAAAGLQAGSRWLAFLSKGLARRKVEDQDRTASA
jgi:ubiquinone/menaquinone biosynthesis C-methylase UbiE